MYQKKGQIRCVNRDLRQSCLKYETQKARKHVSCVTRAAILARQSFDPLVINTCYHFSYETLTKSLSLFPAPFFFPPRASFSF